MARAEALADRSNAQSQSKPISYNGETIPANVRWHNQQMDAINSAMDRANEARANARFTPQSPTTSGTEKAIRRMQNQDMNNFGQAMLNARETKRNKGYLSDVDIQKAKEDAMS